VKELSNVEDKTEPYIHEDKENVLTIHNPCASWKFG
jgi:hypothetical protein